MTPPDTREQARATAHRLIGLAFLPPGADEDKLITFCVVLTTGAPVNHTPLCRAVTDYIIARDAEVATLTADNVAALETMAKWERMSGEWEAEAEAVLTKALAYKAEADTLRSRLSTVERERDEARADLQAEANCLGEARDLLINLANGDDVMDDVRAWLRRPEGLAYLSRSPVEGGRNGGTMTTALFICTTENFHPYECTPDENAPPGTVCRHCAGIKDDTHDPDRCALCHWDDEDFGRPEEPGDDPNVGGCPGCGGNCQTACR